MEAKHKNEEARKAKKGQKRGKMVSLAPPDAIWAPFGRHNREAAPKACPWAPSGHHRCPSSKKSAFAKLGFLHPI